MMRVLMSGGTGFVGQALSRALLARGDQVTVLTRDPRRGRREVAATARVVAWTPGQPGPWEAELSVADAVVHLAGSPISQRWTPSRQKTLASSRIDSANSLVEAIAKTTPRPRVLISASGAGYYGADRPGERLTEDSAPGTDFIGKLCVNWERAADAAKEHGLRTAQLRLGIVVGPGGGAVGEMLPLGNTFVGGPVGRGDNIVAWISLDDAVGMFLMALDDERVRGPVNCTAPYPITQRELAKGIGSVLGRPAVGAPKAVMRMAMGDMVDVICGSVDARPTRAIELGYAFHHTELIPALEAALFG